MGLDRRYRLPYSGPMSTARFARNPDNFAANCAVRCLECGRNGPAADQIRHAKHCDTPVVEQADANQARVIAAVESGKRAAAAPDLVEVAAFARNVRKSGLTNGRDDDVVQAVALGYLSVSDAMNTDD